MIIRRTFWYDDISKKSVCFDIFLGLWNFRSLDSHARVDEHEMATGYHKINGSNTLQDKITHSHKCLSSGSLSNLIDSTDQVIFTMPAKAGGTSMKRFAKACNDDSYKKLGDNSLNSHNQAE